MKILKLSPYQQGYPQQLVNISSPPKQLYYLGKPPQEVLKSPAVAIVGSRKVTPYGQRITEELARGLASNGVVIISGLALGADAIAHRACLQAGGKTIAVLPSGLDKIYPASNRQLARQIIESGGCLISEYDVKTSPQRQNFIARNRLVSGLSQALIITEAAEKSGSLHTAKFALEQGRDVGAVPGDIYSPTSVGSNNLIKTGAASITGLADALQLIGMKEIEPDYEVLADSPEEYTLLKLMRQGITESQDLLKQSGLEAATFNQTLTMLEITGKAKVTSGQWYLL